MTDVIDKIKELYSLLELKTTELDKKIKEEQEAISAISKRSAEYDAVKKSFEIREANLTKYENLDKSFADLKSASEELSIERENLRLSKMQLEDEVEDFNEKIKEVKALEEVLARRSKMLDEREDKLAAEAKNLKENFIKELASKVK